MRPGHLIGGKYRVTRRLGEGAMGSVWAAVNETTHRPFALKLIAPHAVQNGVMRARMMREARASGRISHRNVVEMYDVGETGDGQPFLVMQLLAGISLAELLERAGRLEPSVAAAIAMDVARGLSAAHVAGVVHRDLKPANVFVHEDADGTAVVKVVDFGVSKVLDPGEVSATTTGLAIGSPGYMSPEQARGERDIDHRSDLWSLGVLLFELVTGEMPFQGATVFEVVANILYGDIPRLKDRIAVDDRLDALVEACLERDRERRPASASELIRRLEPLAAMSYSSVLSHATAPGAAVTADELAQTEPSHPQAHPAPHGADRAVATLTAGALSTGVASTSRPGGGRRWRYVVAIAGAALLAGAAVVSFQVANQPAVSEARTGVFARAMTQMPTLSDATASVPAASAKPPESTPSPVPKRPPPAVQSKRRTQAPIPKPPGGSAKQPSGLALPSSPD